MKEEAKILEALGCFQPIQTHQVSTVYRTLHSSINYQQKVIMHGQYLKPNLFISQTVKEI